ncbi:unnamed protein product [Phytophthora lilii]|uniref:DNA-directed DNA polymerase n=1 Tax=Phytophthora lilii TaxID=2077276 RepID=A0A9W6TQU6_9STRA|nr:unnamed protein product [Phytophthora lilii]
MREGAEDSAASRLARYTPQEETIYKAVTEQEYEELVRQRRQGLPFVENDDGEMGYYDDGEEQFFESDAEDAPADRDDDDAAAGKKRGAGALSSSYVRRAKKMQRAKLGGGEGQKITNMFFSASAGKKSNGAAPGAAKGRASAKRDIDLDSMLDDLTSNPTESRTSYARPMSYSSGSTFSSGTSGFTARKTFSTTSVLVSKDNGVKEEEDAVDFEDNSYEPDDADEPMEEASADEDKQDKEAISAEEDATEQEKEEAEPAKPVMSKREMMLRKAREARLQTSAPTARALAAPVEQKHQPENLTMSSVPSNEVAEWWQVAGGGNDVAMADASAADEAEPEDLPTAADSIQMYWMDAVEVRERPGKIYLIGKMKVPSLEGSNQPPTYRSCCVVVNKLQRYMYLVPRGTPLNELSKDEQQQAWMQMHEEIHNILIPSCITNRRDQEVFKTKLVDRNYAFEEANIPRGKNMFLKVKYPARYPAPPSDFCSRGGKTFTRICGAFTRPLENFLLTRRLLGPGWVEIKNVRKCNEGVSFCKMEFETFDPKNVSPIAGGMSPPPLTVMSLSLKSVCNPNTGKHEVVALSAITETGISAEGAGKGTKGAKHTLSHFTAIRPLDENNGFPQAYAEAVQRDDRFGMKMDSGALGINSERLHVEINERVMLSYFLTRVQVEDPDVIVGHNLHKYALELLISRIDNFKLGGLWSKLTRLRRGRLNPMNVGEGWNEYRMDDMVNGRLFCDTYVSSKELLPSQNNYTLSYLVERLLHKQRLDVEMTEIPQILLGGPDNFVKFLRHTLDDAMFVLHLMHKLEILPLSKQLANLCGYLWTRTLEANKRAERIEYLLLHEFSRSKNKFIVPEKFKTRTEADKSNKRREASYAGGMVFAPKKGLYDNFVVLLDFMSLYPSIIRVIERQLNEDAPGAPASSKKKKKKSKPMPQPENDDVVDDEDMDQNLDNADASADSEIPALPSSASEPGILPAVIKRLLESRKQVKQELKIAQKEGNVEKAIMLDIRQKAIKLTANSMYGCLGFRFSRFYAKPIAALITSTGRQTLQRAKEVAEQECGYDVIYGDTDSIMVDSRTESLDEAKRIGREIQAQCNKHFKLLELEVDYIFKRILLLNKKKYAALVLKERPNSEPTFDKDVKGLDMVRRDWCVISKAIGNEVLDFILSGNSRDDVVESIHEHLEQVAERMRSGKEPIEQYVITKSLNKQPEQYPDRAKQYHVQVALALRAMGKPVGAGTHIPYVLCKEEEPGSGRRAYHPDEVKRAGGKLNIDVEWYLESQIHPPVNRLCAHIEGTSSPQLAHCLGLDTAKFSHSANHFEDNDGGDAIPSVLQNDADRFKDCVPLQITCDRCKTATPFPGVFSTSEKDGSLASGLLCPVCKADFWGFEQEGIYGNVGDDLEAVLSNRLHIATREATKKYYEAWTICSDVTCKTRTQKQSLRGNGNICSAAGCRAITTLEYPDSALYTQLKYFESLFDTDRALKKIKEQKERASSTTTIAEPPVLSERHRAVLQKLLTQAEEVGCQPKRLQLGQTFYLADAVYIGSLSIYKFSRQAISRRECLIKQSLLQLCIENGVQINSYQPHSERCLHVGDRVHFHRVHRVADATETRLTRYLTIADQSLVHEHVRFNFIAASTPSANNLEEFPTWFFKKDFATSAKPRLLQASRYARANPKTGNRKNNKVVLLPKKPRYKRLGVDSQTETTLKSNDSPAKTPYKDVISSKLTEMSLFPKHNPAEVTKSPSSLLLLASVASTTKNNGMEFVDTHCARVTATEVMKTTVACGQEDTTFESTSWPINRLSYVELSLQDTAIIEKLFAGRSDTPLLMKWVMLHKSGSKFRHRLLVISALRLWVLKYKKTFGKALVLRREYQLMHVQKLTALKSGSQSRSWVAPNSTTAGNTSTISLRLVILPKQTNSYSEEPVMLHFDPGVHTENFVRLLQRLLHALRLTFPKQQTPPVKLPPDCHWHEFFPDESDSTRVQGENQLEEKSTAKSIFSATQNPIFAAMATAYHAFCDDLGVRFRDSVPTRLEECATTSGCMDFQYCLGFPPGVDGYDHHQDHPLTPLHVFARLVVDACFPSSTRSVAGYQSKEIQALARTLERSRCFTDIVVSDLAMGQASLTILFQALLSPLCTIEGFTLTNIQLSVRALRILQQVALQSTMRQGANQKKLLLHRLDFSFNRFTIAMATELATILQLLPSGLELLQLERCGLTTASCCRIVDALTTSTSFGASLLELNIAGNHLGLEGTKSLATWITGTFALQRLDVSRTQLDINIFIQALKQNTLLYESSLLQLDLSYNQMRTQASQDLGVILGKSQSLATIFLRGMKRFRHFHKLLPPQLQKEGTLLALSEAAVVAQTAAARRNGRTVHRTDGLRKHFLRNILAPMFANTDRSWACMVDLSDNDLSGHRAEVLAQLLDESPWATRTSLRLDHTRCKTLDSLSLEGNGFVKRDAHRKRKRQNEKCYSDGVAPSEPNVIEQAGANALALLLGGALDYSDIQLQNTAAWLGTGESGATSAPFLAYSSAAKPLRLKELCLKCEGSYVFGTHIITAAVQALGKPHTYLQMLDVTGNECGDALAQTLGDVLPKNKSLQALFWDGNCITVDGFLQFYDGLLQNHTLVMVQMPIQDTRRILEEQKDPPREKLFSILGKIFKATERNQILAREAKERKTEARSSREQNPEGLSALVHPNNNRKQENNSKCNEAHCAQPTEPIDADIKQELESAGLALERCSSPKLAEEENESCVLRDGSARKSYSRPTSARYPSTMQSWSMQSSAEDFRAQLSRLDSLTSSMTLTPSHM